MSAGEDSQRPRLAVVVATYEDPGRLALVLEGLARQSRTPDALAVADDGSGPASRELVEAFAERVAYPVQHVWHEDAGFRKMRACNRAVARVDADRYLFLDGDAVPHRHWVADHAAAHGRAAVLCGRRVKLGPRLTPTIDADAVRRGDLERPFGPVLRSALAGDTERFGLGVRLPAPLAALLHPRPRKLMGVNFSVTREAFVDVNGYAHDAPAKREDRELELRLRRAGHGFAALLNRAVVYHLHHPFAPPDAAAQARTAALESDGPTRCADGLAQAG